VLVVEDNVDAAEGLELLLESEGHEVRVVHHALQVMAAIEEFEPTIAFIDIGLPDMSGLELARRLRADARTRHVRLVALTGYGSHEDRAETQRAGFDEHLTKPAEVDALLTLLRSLGTTRPERAAGHGHAT
jgi:CheY-like chemotaxis protein